MSTDEPIFAALGKMLVDFQTLEAILSDGLSHLLQSVPHSSAPQNKLVYAVTSELSFASLSRIASLLPTMFTQESFLVETASGEYLLREALNDCACKLNEGLKLANEVEQRRNQLVHSFWFTGSGFPNPDGTLYRIKTKVKARNISSQFEQETVASINQNSAKAEDAQKLLSFALREYKHIANHKW